MSRELVARLGFISLSTSSFYGPVNFSGSSLVGIGTGSVLFTNSSGSVTGSSNLVWDNVNGRLGIGTSSPSQLLDIAGAIRANTIVVGTLQSPTIYNSNGSLYHTINSTTYNYIWLRGSEIMRLTGDGNLLLGTTTNSGYRLDVNGSGSASGSFRVSGNISAGAGSATAVTFTPTLTATANLDNLTALDVSPTFISGAFSTITNIGIRSTVGGGTTQTPTWAAQFINNTNVFGNNGVLITTYHTTDSTCPLLVNAGGANNTFSIRGNRYLWYNGGNAYFGNFTNASARVHIRGGVTEPSLIVENSSGTSSFQVQANQNVLIGSNTDSGYRLQLNASGSLSGSLLISGSTNQPAIVGNSLTSVNIIPTMVFTTGSQTQTAFKVMPTFSGSSAFTSSQSNIIADFGATSVGSQLIVTDVTSGSIYMVNDVSGIPIIEANSNWDVFMYDYPYTVFKKTGSMIELGVPNQTSSFTLFKSDLIVNEGLGFYQRTSQVSGSTNGAVTSSLYNIQFTNTSASVYISAIVTGYDTGSRDTIAGDIKATIRYRAGVASIVGIDQSFVNSDNSVVGFDIVAGGTSGSLVAFGTGSRVYQWGATITTQVI